MLAKNVRKHGSLLHNQWRRNGCRCGFIRTEWRKAGE